MNYKCSPKQNITIPMSRIKQYSKLNENGINHFLWYLVCSSPLHQGYLQPHSIPWTTPVSPLRQFRTFCASHTQIPSLLPAVRLPRETNKINFHSKSKLWSPNFPFPRSSTLDLAGGGWQSSLPNSFPILTLENFALQFFTIYKLNKYNNSNKLNYSN